MKIVKCSKCGKYLCKSKVCFHCGNSTEFSEIKKIEIHENVIQEYAKVEDLIEDKKFDEAFSISNIVVEWMPKQSGIFFLRLLAKKHCTSELELMKKGFDCENDPDMCNALAFSEGAEYSMYLDIQNTIIAMKKLFKMEILNHKNRCKLKTDILQIKETMQNQIETRKKKLFSMYKKLEEEEDSLYVLETDCRLLLEEHKKTLEQSAYTSGSIKEEVYRLEDCTEEDFSKYQIKIGSVLWQAEQAEVALATIKKQHPWIKAFQNLVNERNGQIQLIKEELTSLKYYEDQVQQTIDEITEIEERHEKVICSVEEYDFSDAFGLLGEACCNKILKKVGIERAMSVREWKDSTELDNL